MSKLKRTVKKRFPFLAKKYCIIRDSSMIRFFIKPTYERSRDQIEIDITYLCNMNCINCNRSSSQAPSNEYLTVEQIKKFIKESIDRNLKWKRIALLGGEPTLHPNIIEILNLLLKFKKDHTPSTRIQLVTNGSGKKVNSILAKVPEGIEIRNTLKKSKFQYFYQFNNAPKDSVLYKNADYSKGCVIPSACGIGLTRYGYYPCAIAGGIDRIFGFDCGRKKIPSLDDPMIDQLKIFCSLCGYFRYNRSKNPKEIISPTWKRAYEDYKKRKPKLSLY